jgi:hypothetical protein
MSAALTAASSAAIDGSTTHFATGQNSPAGFTLTNHSLSWQLASSDARIHSSQFENKLSGRVFPLSAAQELVLTFSASRRRVEIPWWNFVFGSEESFVPADQEQGFVRGYHHPDFAETGWGVTENLLLRGLNGLKKVPAGITYDGYGWFRRWFVLPDDAQHTEIVFVLGGYDHLDWNEYWIYVNATEISHRSASGRWRNPGQYSVKPGTAGHAALHFGSPGKNLLAIRTRGYDKHFGGLSDEALNHYVFEPVLVDQFVSVGQPYLEVSDFEVRRSRQISDEEVILELRSSTQPLNVAAHYQLLGETRRKWFEISNAGDRELLLLDVHLDDFTIAAASLTEGGLGEPVFIGGEAFSVLEHPAGLNRGDKGRVRLGHFPARQLAPGGSMRTPDALLSVAAPGRALDQFTSYIQRGSPRKQRAISLYTPYGINNQWGGCPALTDVETLDITRTLEKLQQKGLKFEYFTLDQGWLDPAANLTRFAPQCFPDGPAKTLERVRTLGMKFGLWFSVSGAGWSCGEYPPVQPSFNSSLSTDSAPAPVEYRNGYIANGGVSGQLCVASEPYFSILKDAVLYHIEHNGLKLFKLDIGNYYCNSTTHGHLPGKYSVEASYERLLDVARAAKKAEPDIYLMWYWGVGSPLFALHGDSIFESGLFMEGAGTTWFPALYFRDSVTLNLDQSTVFTKTIPPINKDSLGVWLAETRWGNFMGNQRWRESLVMDLGRGNLLFPQLWGDINLLSERDIEWLVAITSLARKHEPLLLRPRKIVGDAWKNEVYGYSYFDGARGLVFLNNCHFTSRKALLRLDSSLGLEAPSGTPVEIASHFPEWRSVLQDGGDGFKTGSVAELWLRPFEVLMLEIGPVSKNTGLAPRAISGPQAAGLGTSLRLQPSPLSPWMNIEFADAARFEQLGYKKKILAFESTVRSFAGEHGVLAVAIRLRQGGVEWRYSPAVVEIVQLVAWLGDHQVQFIPVPNARQYGNTQKAGCSWAVYKLRLTPEHSGRPFRFAVHAFVPDKVEPLIEAWMVSQWWEEDARPLGDGYYGDEPS